MDSREQDCLAHEAMTAIGLPEGALPLARIWVQCLVAAASIADVTLTAEDFREYSAQGMRLYGIRIGSWLKERASYGLGSYKGKPVIRAHAEVVRGAADTILNVAIGIIGGSTVWYFALHPNGDILISVGDEATNHRDGRIGEDAIIGAAWATLAVKSGSS